MPAAKLPDSIGRWTAVRGVGFPAPHRAGYAAASFSEVQPRVLSHAPPNVIARSHRRSLPHHLAVGRGRHGRGLSSMGQRA